MVGFCFYLFACLFVQMQLILPAFNHVEPVVCCLAFEPTLLGVGRICSVSFQRWSLLPLHMFGDIAPQRLHPTMTYAGLHHELHHELHLPLWSDMWFVDGRPASGEDGSCWDISWRSPAEVSNTRRWLIPHAPAWLRSRCALADAEAAWAQNINTQG